jgi:hypothetical protein
MAGSSPGFNPGTGRDERYPWVVLFETRYKSDPLMRTHSKGPDREFAKRKAIRPLLLDCFGAMLLTMTARGVVGAIFS